MEFSAGDPSHMGWYIFLHIITQGLTALQVCICHGINHTSTENWRASSSLKENVSSLIHVWKSLRSEWEFCCGNTGQERTSFSCSQKVKIPKGPWPLSLTSDQGRHFRRREVQKKRMKSKEFLCCHCLKKGTYNSTEGKVGEKFSPGKREEGHFP